MAEGVASSTESPEVLARTSSLFFALQNRMPINRSLIVFIITLCFGLHGTRLVGNTESGLCVASKWV